MEDHSLGEHNTRRRVRDIYDCIKRFTELPLTKTKYAAFILTVGQLVLNVGSIIYAWAERRPNAPDNYAWAHKVVVWTEFIVICCLLARTSCMAMLLARVMWKEALAEWREEGSGYRYRLMVASHLRLTFRSMSYWRFSLLSVLPKMNPLNMFEYCRQLGQYVKNRTLRVVLRFDRWFGDQSAASHCMAQAIVLAVAAVKLGFQLALSGLAVVAVFLKLLQLTFLGNTPLSDWRFAQALAFIQFVNNMVSIDQSYSSKMVGKYEFIFCGKDAASSTEERRAKAFFEQLALMLLRQRHGSLMRALVVYSAMCSEDVNLVFLEDEIDERWMTAAKTRKQRSKRQKDTPQKQRPSAKAAQDGGGEEDGRVDAPQGADGGAGGGSVAHGYYRYPSHAGGSGKGDRLYSGWGDQMAAAGTGCGLQWQVQADGRPCVHVQVAADAEVLHGRAQRRPQRQQQQQQQQPERDHPISPTKPPLRQSSSGLRLFGGLRKSRSGLGAGGEGPQQPQQAAGAITSAPMPPQHGAPAPHNSPMRPPYQNPYQQQPSQQHCDATAYHNPCPTYSGLYVDPHAAGACQYRPQDATGRTGASGSGAAGSGSSKRHSGPGGAGAAGAGLQPPPPAMPAAGAAAGYNPLYHGDPYGAPMGAHATAVAAGWAVALPGPGGVAAAGAGAGMPRQGHGATRVPHRSETLRARYSAALSGMYDTTGLE
ncbi:hypothetical protein HYH02_013569 [Chlamydomonas schloesseri]|uniref:Uncharacterized protein n=1 Tax=Chlamydomonas schloesseri TaxID=2026947 RepID=A0A835SYU0_9CHLO|nr:hypothetical protein HYH02_013569 [Chlamydomonas schloesseri]|eukprot:KAG2430729.1 hypothetical protein HYH02_013569 [Chlamydomonas schloesseri]